MSATGHDLVESNVPLLLVSVSIVRRVSGTWSQIELYAKKGPSAITMRRGYQPNLTIGPRRSRVACSFALLIMAKGHEAWLRIVERTSYAFHLLSFSHSAASPRLQATLFFALAAILCVYALTASRALWYCARDRGAVRLGRIQIVIGCAR